METRIRKLAPLAGDLVSTGGAARALGLTGDKLRRAVQRGIVTPAAVTPGGHRRYPADGIRSLLQGHRDRDEHGAASASVTDLSRRRENTA